MLSWRSLCAAAGAPSDNVGPVAAEFARSDYSAEVGSLSHSHTAALISHVLLMTDKDSTHVLLIAEPQPISLRRVRR